MFQAGRTKPVPINLEILDIASVGIDMLELRDRWPALLAQQLVFNHAGVPGLKHRRRTPRRFSPS